VESRELVFVYGRWRMGMDMIIDILGILDSCSAWNARNGWFVLRFELFRNGLDVWFRKSCIFARALMDSRLRTLEIAIEDQNWVG
jgi:hypothetical protein